MRIRPQDSCKPGCDDLEKNLKINLEAINPNHNPGWISSFFWQVLVFWEHDLVCNMCPTKSFTWRARCHRCHSLCHNSPKHFNFLPRNCHHACSGCHGEGTWPCSRSQAQLLAQMTRRIILQMGQPRTRVPTGIRALLPLCCLLNEDARARTNSQLLKWQQQKTPCHYPGWLKIE